MTELQPIWVNTRDVLVIHEKLLHQHGGDAGVRDLGLLDSALARAQNHYAYGERDLCLLATYHASGIVRNHPFNDGNKRAGFMAAFVFLGVNGLDLRADEADAVRAVLGLTDRSMTEEQFAVWLRDHCVADVTPKRRRTSRKKP